MIHIRVLGNPEITQDDHPLRITRVAVRSLLFYLACNPKGVTRSNLINTLWPESGQASRRLTEALSKLRAELALEDAVLSNRNLISLNSKHVWVDLWQFERLFERTRRSAIQTPIDAALPEITVHDLRAAVKLWRSYTLLDGAELIDSPELDQFIARERARLENSLIYTLRRLSQHAYSSGDLAEAIHLGEETLKIDPLHPELNYFLIQALYRAGRTRTAMDYYERMKDFYDPQDPALHFFEPLLEKIRGKIPASELHNPVPEVPWLDWKVSNSVFVGREDIFERLQNAFQRGGAVALIGESGIGKTRLVQEFYQRLRLRPRIFLARGHRGEHSQPLYPLIESLRFNMHSQDWQQMDRLWAAHLAHLMPELRQYRSDLPEMAPNTLENSRQLIFESFRQLVLTMTSEQRSLFLLEDAHWADLVTLDTLSYLLERNSFKDRGLLILNIRSEEINPALQAFLHKFNPKALEIILVNPLSIEEISDLAHKFFGTPPPVALAQRLAANTGGNSLFLVETLRELSNYRMDELTTVEYLPTTQSMRALVQDRIHLLDPNERILVETAAVLGDEFKIGMLETCCEMSGIQVVQGLEKLNRLNLVQPVAGLMPDSYRFSHQKTREIILGELSPARTRWLHRCATRVLENMEVHPAQLAEHYTQGGEALKAFRQWLKAAEYDLRIFAVHEALDAFAQAESLIAELTHSLDEDEVNNLYTNWCEIATVADQLDEAEKACQHHLQLGEQRHSVLLKGSALSELSFIALLRSQPFESAENIQKALFFLTQTQDFDQILKAYTRQGLLLVYSNRFIEAQQVMELAMQFRSTLATPHSQKVRADAESQLSMVYSIAGFPTKALELANQALIESRQAQYGSGILFSMLCLVIAFHTQGDYTACCNYAREAILVAEVHKNQRQAALLRCYFSRSLAALGKCDEAWEEAQQALNIALRGNFPEVLGSAYCALGDVAAYLLDFPAAKEYYQTGIDMQPIGAQNLDNRLRLHTIHLQGKNWKDENAFAQLRQVISEAESQGMGTVLLAGKIALATILANSGEISQAQEIALQLKSELAERGSFYYLEVKYEWLLVNLALQAKDTSVAQQHARNVVDIARNQGLFFTSLFACSLHALTGGENDVQARLDILDSHCRCAELRPAFRRFRKLLSHQ